MIRHNGWRDVEHFINWEAQSGEQVNQAIHSFHRREAQLTHSQAIARRLFIGLMLCVTAGVLVAWQWDAIAKLFGR